MSETIYIYRKGRGKVHLRAPLSYATACGRFLPASRWTRERPTGDLCKQCQVAAGDQTKESE